MRAVLPRNLHPRRLDRGVKLRLYMIESSRPSLKTAEGFPRKGDSFQLLRATFGTDSQWLGLSLPSHILGKIVALRIFDIGFFPRKPIELKASSADDRKDCSSEESATIHSLNN